MAQCVAVDGSGFVVAASAPPAECTSFVLLNPLEYGLWINSPLNLSLEDGAVLGGAIVGIWAAAFAWRAAIRALDTDGEKEA